MTVALEEEATFGINTVSRMTGIPVDTLRMWERRYDAVVPQRSSDNKRRYTAADVARLRVFKNLVDLGHSIGSVARLPIEALNERLQVHAEMDDAQVATPDVTRRPGILVYGEELPFQVQGWTEALTALNITGTHTLYAEFENDAMNRKPDVLLIQCPSLQRDMETRFRDLMRRTTAQRLVLVYTYASSTVIDRLNRQGIVTLRTPVTVENLHQACQLQPNSNRDTPYAWFRLPDDDPVPPRRYNGENLASVMLLANRVRCECPQHMVDLIQRLGAFEAYSADCENRNIEDALLHSHLNRMAGKARGLVEDALERWLQIENIQLPDNGGEEAED